MIINSIIDISDKYKVVYFDDGFFFKAKNWEIKKLGMTVDQDISDDKYEQIYKEFGIKRCRFKAIDILARSDKSEKELRDKLSKAYYSPMVIDEVISQLIKLKYVDDERFTYNYILANRIGKSKFQIKQKLYEKGISGYFLDNLLEDLYEEETEKTIIIKCANKYAKNSNITRKEYEKILSAMYRKGISQRLVRTVIDEYFNIVNEYREEDFE